MEQRAGPLHWDQHLVVAPHPGQVAGPAAAFHVKAAVFQPQLADGVSPRQAKQSAPLSDLDVQLLPAASVAAVLARWGILQARVVQLRHRAGTKTAWRPPCGAPRQRPPAVRLMGRCLPVGRRRGRPDNANRRSAECTDRRPRASASKCSGGPCRAPSRARWRSPEPTGLPAAHEASPPLAWLPGSNQPTKPAGTPSRSRIVVPPYSRAGMACRGPVWSGR